MNPSRRLTGIPDRSTRSWPVAAFIVLQVACDGAESEPRRARLHDAAAAPDAMAQRGTDDDAGSEHDDAGTSRESEWKPLSPDQTIAGHSLADWVTRWVAWHLAVRDCFDTPYFDATGAKCQMHQEGRTDAVFYLEGGEYPTVRAECTVEGGKALLVPMVYYIADGQMFGINQSRAAMNSHAYAQKLLATMRDLRLEIDGWPVPEPSRWLVEPTAFKVTVPPHPNFYSCPGYAKFEGELSGFVVGYFAILPPPPRGKYKLRYGGTFSTDGFDLVTDVSTVLTVQ